ncbi:MAG TPA: hypothetical protein VGB94_06710 [Acidobacteriaceae bacterium]
MVFLKSIFGSSAKVSPLEAALQKITWDDAARMYETASDPTLKVPGAVSMTVLRMAHNFSTGLLKMAADFSKKSGAPSPQPSYDAIAFETAAYAHFWSMKDYRLADANDLEDEEEDESRESLENSDKPRDADLITSTLISDRFIAQYTTFDLPDRFFANRAMSYCRSSDTRIDIPELISRFEHKLSSSILAGKPGNQKQREFDLPLDLALKACIPIFQINSLPALSEIVDGLFKAEGPARAE